jgi:hypothetical protein
LPTQAAPRFTIDCLAIPGKPPSRVSGAAVESPWENPVHRIEWSMRTPPPQSKLDVVGPLAPPKRLAVLPTQGVAFVDFDCLSDLTVHRFLRRSVESAHNLLG